MSDEEPIDISARDLMPGWLDDLDNPEKTQKKYADHEGGEGKRGRGGPRRDEGFGGQPRGDGKGRQGGGGQRPPGGGGDRGRGRDGQRPSGGGRGPRQGGRDGGRGGGRRDEERRPAPPAPIEGLDVKLLPEQSALESIATFVRKTGRAYPMWDIAQAMLGARERYRIGFRKSKDAGVMAPDLLRCSLDDSLWLKREEGLEHVVRSGLLSRYYRTEEVEMEPPKGNFAVIAVHRKSGTVLGPPNHHEYQRNLVKLHQKRFSHVPFDRFSKEIDMRRDEETIEEWKKSVSVVKHWVHVGLHDSSPSEESGSESAVSDASSEGLPKEEARTAQEDQPPGGEAEAPGEEEEAPAVEKEEVSVTEEVSVGEEVDGGTPPLQEEAPAEEGAAAVEEAAEEAPVAEPVADDAPSEDVAPAEEDLSAGDAASDEAPVEEAASVAEEASAVEEEILKSEDEVAKHFDETYGEVVFFPIDKFFVPGDIKGSQLSRGLLALLRREVEGRQQAPMSLIQDLCRGLETYGVKFFKEGKKMFVSAARPRALEETVIIGDLPKRLLDFVKEHQGTTGLKMMEGLVPGFVAPKKGEKMPEHKPTAEEMQFVSDMRWLTSEGYLVEYSSGRVRLGSEAGKTPGKDGAKHGEQRKKRGGRGQRSLPRPQSGSQKGGAERRDIAEPASEASGIKVRGQPAGEKPGREEGTISSERDKGQDKKASPEGESDSKADSPVAEGAAVDEAPVVEAPIVEAPVVEAPIVEAPIVEAPVEAEAASEEVEGDSTSPSEGEGESEAKTSS